MNKLFKFQWRGRSATSSKYFPFFSMGDRPRLPPSSPRRRNLKSLFISKSLANGVVLLVQMILSPEM